MSRTKKRSNLEVLFLLQDNQFRQLKQFWILIEMQVFIMNAFECNSHWSSDHLRNAFMWYIEK